MTYLELVHEAVSGVLAQADLQAKDIDAVVHGSMDPSDGVFALERWNVDACVGAGALNKPFLKLTTGGPIRHHAPRRWMSFQSSQWVPFRLTFTYVVLAVTSQRVGETLEAQLVLNICIDPIYERWMGGGAITIGANQAAHHFHVLMILNKEAL